MKSNCSKPIRFIIYWFVFFTLLCIINSILVIPFELYSTENGYLLAFLLPFIHCGITVLAWMVYGIIYHGSEKKSGIDGEYIRQNYPQIWKKLHPWGEGLYNGFRTHIFMKGKYDDGTDETLNEIKALMKLRSNIIAYPFLLTLGVWILNFVLIALFQPGHWNL